MSVAAAPVPVGSGLEEEEEEEATMAGVDGDEEEEEERITEEVDEEEMEEEEGAAVDLSVLRYQHWNEAVRKVRMRKVSYVKMIVTKSKDKGKGNNARVILTS